MSAEECPVCTKAPVLDFFFHGVFMDITRVWISLTEFQKDVLHFLRVASNAWGLVRAFELALEHIGRVPSAKVFFSFFDVFRRSELGTDRVRQNHVSLRCNKE